MISATSFNASHAPRCVACQGVRSHPVPVGVLHLLSSGSPAPGLTGWRFPGVEYPVNLARFRHTTPEGLMDHGRTSPHRRVQPDRARAERSPPCAKQRSVPAESRCRRPDENRGCPKSGGTGAQSSPMRARHSSGRLSASRAAPWTARHGVRSHPVPVALVGACSIPVV